MNVTDVAKYIINYPDIYVDNLKLQKLLFYSQAVSLVLNNKSLFDEPIEAWDYGPVIRKIYNSYKSYDQQIPRVEDNIDLDTKDVEMIDIALGYYGKMSGPQLITLTHSEKPWKEAYAKGRNTEITANAIKDFYSTIYHYE